MEFHLLGFLFLFLFFVVLFLFLFVCFVLFCFVLFFLFVLFCLVFLKKKSAFLVHACFDSFFLHSQGKRILSKKICKQSSTRLKKKTKKH